MAVSGAEEMPKSGVQTPHVDRKARKEDARISHLDKMHLQYSTICLRDK